MLTRWRSRHHRQSHHDMYPSNLHSDHHSASNISKWTVACSRNALSKINIPFFYKQMFSSWTHSKTPFTLHKSRTLLVLSISSVASPINLQPKMPSLPHQPSLRAGLHQLLYKLCLKTVSFFPCFPWGFSQWKGLTLQAPEPVPNIGPESSRIVIPGYKYAGSLWETHQNWWWWFTF